MLANSASPTATWAEPGPLTRPPRGALRPATAIILAALWIASIANLALWRALAGLPELANGRGLAFGIGFGVMIAAAHVALLSLLAWR